MLIIHDRSTGHGGLAIWLYHYRDGFVFNNANPHLEDCPATGWTGSTLTIKGAYAWSDIYPAAREKGVIIVGGYNYVSCPSLNAIHILPQNFTDVSP